MNRQPVASAILAAAIGLTLACVLFFGLSGCGGSSSADAPDVKVGPPDCVNYPELCK